MTDRYAVIGNPIAHSKSPFIHSAFARQTQQDMRYEALLAPIDGFAAAVKNFRAEGGRGLNVTLPFKVEAFELCHERTPRAQAAGAVNTIRFDGATLLGDNTDGAGLMADLYSNLHFDVGARSVLLLGAGGAARGVVLPLLHQRPASLTIANRTVGKAVELANLFQGLAAAVGLGAIRLNACDFESLAGGAFDLVINATSASLANAAPVLPPGIYGPQSLAYDMVYGKGRTPFLQQAAAAGAARVSDGLGMLVEQAAESFLLWRGVRPDTTRVLFQMREGG
jgi:shikimate dehydrogenase